MVRTELPDMAVRRQLVQALEGGQAYDSIPEILAEIPENARFAVPQGAERSPWQILEHMRLALEDLAAFSANENGGYVELNWPDDYWPPLPDPGDPSAWTQAIEGFGDAQKRMQEVILDPERDLLEPFPWGEGQTLLREAIVALEHNAYHAGQLTQIVAGRTK